MVKNRMIPGDGDPRHGTANGYTNQGCRCDLCRAANVELNKRQRAKREGSLAPDDPRHGKPSTYSNYRCRCELCRAANAERARVNRERRKAVAA